MFLKGTERRRKGASLVFMAIISSYSRSVDYAAPAAVGGYRWWTFVRVLSKLFLLKERRERIISHLLSIRFTHNAAAVLAWRALLPLLIAAMVAVSVLLPSFFSLKSDVWCCAAFVAAVAEFAVRVLFILFISLPFNVLPLSVCCFRPVQLRGDGLIYYLMD